MTTIIEPPVGGKRISCGTRTSAGQLDRHVVASPRPCSSSEHAAGIRRYPFLQRYLVMSGTESEYPVAIDGGGRQIETQPHPWLQLELHCIAVYKLCVGQGRLECMHGNCFRLRRACLRRRTNFASVSWGAVTLSPSQVSTFLRVDCKYSRHKHGIQCSSARSGCRARTSEPDTGQSRRMRWLHYRTGEASQAMKRRRRAVKLKKK